MKLFSNISFFLSILFSLYVFLLVYKIISKTKIKWNLSKVLILIILALIQYLSNSYILSSYKIIISIFVVLCAYKIFFKDNFVLMIFKFFIIYVILTISDFLMSIIFLFFPIDSTLDIRNMLFLRTYCTILDSLLLLLIFLCPCFLKNLRKLLDYINSKRNFIILFLSCLVLIVFLILTYLTATNFNIKMFFITTLLLTLFLFLCFAIIYQYFINKYNEEEQKSLFNLMYEYEKILENERINRHEMLNNLIILKSYKNKNSKEYNETIDDIISIYQSKKTDVYSNLYKLPSGIKGIIYYKMSNIKESNINFNLLCAHNIEERFYKLDNKLYFKVSKILGIVLDNAIEAASLTEEKFLFIDIYYDDELIIYIENTFVNNIDLNEISQIGVSSKGENRGYGLYIVSKLLQDTRNLEFDQHIENNKFITVLKIKNPS